MASRPRNYVDSLPEDCINIKKYNGKEFENLYYSPSEKALYQAPEIKYKKLNQNERGYVRPVTKDGTATQISLTSIEKHLEDVM